MEKGVNPDLFVNDGSFMEKFKQLQQDKHEKDFAEESKSGTAANSILSIKPVVISNKRSLEIKSSDMKKPSPSGSSGKLAFSLKQKSKIVSAPVKLAEDEEDDRAESEPGISEESTKRLKLGQSDAFNSKPDNGDGNDFLFTQFHTLRNMVIFSFNYLFPSTFLIRCAGFSFKS